MIQKIFSPRSLAIILLSMAVSVANAQTAPANSADDLGLIPKPVQLEKTTGVFSLTANTRIIAGAGAETEAANLAKWLRVPTGLPLAATKSAANGDLPNTISLTLEPSLTAKLGAEGYTLSVTPQHVAIRAATTAGLFYGGVTLRQLLPPQIYSKTAVSGIAWNAPCVEITDYPRFAWRGMMLDCSRHFMPKEFVLKFIDLLARQKMNRFHWHLVDSEGWRLEIKGYPKLTAVSENAPGSYPDEGYNKHPLKYDYGHFHGGGFYTQDDVREIVACAAARHIMIIPEIEFPGHSMAALTAYPEFSTTGKPPVLASNATPDIYNVDDKSLNFLREVLRQTMELFPGSVIHFGGDEAPKGQWNASPFVRQKIKSLGLKNANALQIWMFNQMANFIANQHRRPAAWQELTYGGVDKIRKDAIIMPWISMKPGIAAANAGLDIVVATVNANYFNARQRQNTPPRVYAQTFEYPEITPANRHHVLGAQGELWAEFMLTPSDVEHFAFPQSAALAEALWTPLAEKNFGDFCKRLTVMAKRWDVMHVNYHPLAPAPIGEWSPALLKKNNGALDFAVSQKIAPGKYLAHFDYSGGANGLDITKVELLANGQVVATDAHAGFAGGQSHGNLYTLEIPATANSGATWTLRVSAKGAGGNDSHGTIQLDPAKL